MDIKNELNFIKSYERNYRNLCLRCDHALNELIICTKNFPIFIYTYRHTCIFTYIHKDIQIHLYK